MEKARNLSFKMGVSTLSDVNAYQLPVLIKTVQYWQRDGEAHRSREDHREFRKRFTQTL